ncbi:hypothetical protein BAE44_0020329 [Dichanthelium oligosanthes]|uniref:Disease resistance protein winged helix domain-containing protein n=1 Tax=Dichanthelium oligosanthes TaxID=888268 RepID=A0A1E5V0G3_9POAL|nr:hypothetical protein BAE44_0020329 [Dichanthelium oligosanthes]
MDKESLIQIWAGLGYLRKDVGMSVEEKGEMVFADLVSRCFLQVVRTTEVDFIYGGDQVYQPVKCIMHDLVHDLAKFLNDECFGGEELVQLQDGVSTRFACQVMISEHASLSQFQEIGGVLDSMELEIVLQNDQMSLRTKIEGEQLLQQVTVDRSAAAAATNVELNPFLQMDTECFFLAADANVELNPFLHMDTKCFFLAADVVNSPYQF